jgi:hypothetical protein
MNLFKKKKDKYKPQTFHYAVRIWGVIQVVDGKNNDFQIILDMDVADLAEYCTITLIFKGEKGKVVNEKFTEKIELCKNRTFSKGDFKFDSNLNVDGKMGAIYIHPKHRMMKDIWYLGKIRSHSKLHESDAEEVAYPYLEAVMMSTGSGPKPKKHEWVNRDAELDIKFKNESAMRRYA